MHKKLLSCLVACVALVAPVSLGAPTFVRGRGIRKLFRRQEPEIPTISPARRDISDFYVLTDKFMASCLGAADKNSTSVTVGNCNGDDGQLWKSGGGKWTNVLTGLCLTVQQPGNVTTPLTLDVCGRTKSEWQQFSSPTKPFVNTKLHKCVAPCPTTPDKACSYPDTNPDWCNAGSADESKPLFNSKIQSVSFCTLPQAIGEWKPTNVSQCTKTCGGGSATRNFECAPMQGGFQSVCCSDEDKPSAGVTCNPQPCQLDPTDLYVLQSPEGECASINGDAAGMEQCKYSDGEMWMPYESQWLNVASGMCMTVPRLYGDSQSNTATLDYCSTQGAYQNFMEGETTGFKYPFTCLAKCKESSNLCAYRDNTNDIFDWCSAGGAISTRRYNTKLGAVSFCSLESSRGVWKPINMSECSTTCGGGKRAITSKCVPKSGGDGLACCEGSATVTEPCALQPCSSTNNDQYVLQNPFGSSSVCAQSDGLGMVSLGGCSNTEANRWIYLPTGQWLNMEAQKCLQVNGDQSPITLEPCGSGSRSTQKFPSPPPAVSDTKYMCLGPCAANEVQLCGFSSSTTQGWCQVSANATFNQRLQFNPYCSQPFANCGATNGTSGISNQPTAQIQPATVAPKPPVVFTTPTPIAPTQALPTNQIPAPSTPNPATETAFPTFDFGNTNLPTAIVPPFQMTFTDPFPPPTGDSQFPTNIPSNFFATPTESVGFLAPTQAVVPQQVIPANWPQSTVQMTANGGNQKLGLVTVTPSVTTGVVKPALVIVTPSLAPRPT